MRALRLKDPVVQEVLRLSELAEHRRNKQRCVIAGTKLVRDLSRRHRLHDLLIRRPDDAASEGLEAEKTHVVDEKSLRRCAQLTQFDGLVATVDMPKPRQDLERLKLLLCLDHIEQPGLLGTVLRTAMAFQWQGVFFLPNCADPFDQKCIRASQGALFEIPHARGTMEDLHRLCERLRLQLCVSHSQGADIGRADYDPPPDGLALLLREEYAAPWGPPREALKIRIPDPLQQRRRPDSLDKSELFDCRALDVAVAGGILMHHIRYFHYPTTRAR